MTTVTIYRTPNCQYCQKAKELFDANGIEYKEINVLEDRQAFDRMIDITGVRSVPCFEIGDEWMVGYDEATMKAKFGIN